MTNTKTISQGFHNWREEWPDIWIDRKQLLRWFLRATEAEAHGFYRLGDTQSENICCQLAMLEEDEELAKAAAARAYNVTSLRPMAGAMQSAPKRPRT